MTDSARARGESRYVLLSPFAKEVVARIIESSAVAQSFLSTFPNSEVFVTGWLERNGAQTLNAKGLGFDRYEVTLKVGFYKNDGRSPHTHGVPSFSIWERSRVIVDDTGRVDTVEYQLRPTVAPQFDEAAWWRFVERGNDWAAIGVREVRKDPVPVVRR
jgi:hypothetical protein